MNHYNRYPENPENFALFWGEDDTGTTSENHKDQRGKLNMIRAEYYAEKPVK